MANSGLPPQLTKAREIYNKYTKKGNRYDEGRKKMEDLVKSSPASLAAVRLVHAKMLVREAVHLVDRQLREQLDSRQHRLAHDPALVPVNGGTPAVASEAEQALARLLKQAVDAAYCGLVVGGSVQVSKVYEAHVEQGALCRSACACHLLPGRAL